MPESAYPELFEGLDAATRKVVKLSLGRPAPGQLPSREEVADLIDQVESEGVKAVFGSEVFPSPVLEQIGKEAGVRYVDELR